jgi:CRISPR-associated endonuclease/helicase Cas3
VSNSTDSAPLELSALDGANPLGFLTALGTLVTAQSAGEAGAQLRFQPGSTWRPIIEGVSASTREGFSDLIAGGLAGRRVPDEAERARAGAQHEFDAAKKAYKDKKEEIRKRGLKGRERALVFERELDPLGQAREQRRSLWLKALAAAVPRAELALGKRIDCTAEEYRAHAAALFEDAKQNERDALDLLAAFGSDACLADRSDAIQPTPFCFITGSGHQFFLDTVRQLIDHVTTDRVHQALFEPWTYGDQGLSMRWDPVDDRRYALMDRDPTASDNKSRTVWMANLLAYRALVLFPSAPCASRLGVTGWSGGDQEPTFTWPIWDFAAPPDTVRALLQLRELTDDRPDRGSLRARGVACVYRAHRIKVGAGANYKLNFSPARAR